MRRYLIVNCQETRFELSAKKVIFNNVVGRPDDYLNSVCMMTKYHIYATRCKNEFWTL